MENSTKVSQTINIELPCMRVLSHFSHDFATLWTIACQVPLSMRFSRQEYWSGLPCPPPGDLPNPGIFPTHGSNPRPLSPALTGGFFTTVPPVKPRTAISLLGIYPKKTKIQKDICTPMFKIGEGY